MNNEKLFTAKKLCHVENFLYQNDAAPDDADSLMNTLVTYFQVVGELIAEADGYTSNIEHTKIKQFIQTIKDYALENTLSPFFNY